MSSGPIRNVPRCRRAQTPFYPLIEFRPGPLTSRLQVIPAHVHDVIEIISDDEDAGQPEAASVIDLTITDDKVASQASVDVHREPTFAVGTEDIADILSDDEAAQQAGNVMPIRNTSLSDALAAATAELETLRTAIQKICTACLKRWFQSCWTRWVAYRLPPVRLTSRDILTLPLSLAVISAVKRRFGRVPLTCPTCWDLIGKHQPYKVIALSQLSVTLSSLGGEQGEEDPSTDWTGVIPESRILKSLLEHMVAKSVTKDTTAERTNIQES
ncbi:uncharacterized protein F5147DRAFT_657138 [Suillus discolor]|uniref:Uncharacterized protein n=1 Tax=Suillus discolor TaxID=1912936 RepID=A0A9P7EXL9_9AGAM|nr:uncharacterized protein F5147DRAFT_657138 [Suillus discolor]KAG2094666.1 hypothetical protein F5147DRAFT_657138 [Suillus discolor]